MLNLISRLGETRPEQEWSNGTEFSGYSDFPEFKANLARYTQNFGMKFQKMTVPFTLHPGISRIFGRMESAPGFKMLFIFSRINKRATILKAINKMTNLMCKTDFNARNDIIS